MQIEAETLERLLAIILKHQAELGHTNFEVSKDYYWNIAQEERYDPYAEPSQFTLGQLTDDWNELQKLIDDPDKAIGYSLVWMGNILRAIGEDYVG